MASLASSARANAQQPSPREIDPDNFVSGVSNPFFPLVPGTVYHYADFDVDDPVKRELRMTSE